MMWTHFCKSDKAWLGVEKGKPCNWCDAAEKPAQGAQWDTRKQSVDPRR
jgi:hypothetical protein